MQNAAGTGFVDLSATGSQPFIKSEALEILANGSAVFSGVVASDVFTASEIQTESIRVSYGAQIICDGGPSYGDGVAENIGGIWSFDPGIITSRLDMGTAYRIAVNVNDDLEIRGPLLLGESGADLAFYGGTPGPKPTITGSRGGNAALADLLTELEALGLIVDSTS